MAALVMVAALVRLPAASADIGDADGHGAGLVELVDTEGFEWVDPGWVA